jgi:hypothetical protein
MLKWFKNIDRKTHLFIIILFSLVVMIFMREISIKTDEEVTPASVVDIAFSLGEILPQCPALEAKVQKSLLSGKPILEIELPYLQNQCEEEKQNHRKKLSLADEAAKQFGALHGKDNCITTLLKSMDYIHNNALAVESLETPSYKEECEAEIAQSSQEYDDGRPE